MCQHADRSLSAVLIHAVALPVLEQLIHHATADKPRDEAEVAIVIEGMRLAEILVSLAEEHTSKNLLLVLYSEFGTLLIFICLCVFDVDNIYTVFRKKRCHFIFACNSAKF